MMRSLPCCMVLPALMTGGMVTGQVAQDSRPNIIFIMTDDHSPFPLNERKSTQSRPFGFNGDKYVFTPNIDELAGNGIVFSRAYVSSSICSPSRYSILTGKYAGRCEGNAFISQYPPGTQSRVENNTELENHGLNIAKLLQNAGYTTGFVGKSHVVDHHLLTDKNRGELGFMTYPQDADPKSPEVSAAMKFNHDFWVGRMKDMGFDYADAVHAANLRELYNDSSNAHNPEWINRAALEFIGQQGDKPFFLYYSETMPHGPAPWIKRNGKYIHGLDANPGFTGEGYLTVDSDFMPRRAEIKAEIENMEDKDPDHAWLRWLDHAVGAVVSKLKEKGLMENTLIVITSDHGNFNFGKSTLYESGVRVPLLMHWPAGIRNPGRVYDELVQNIDFAPTFLDLAGVPQNPESKFDGVSLKKVLKGSNKPVHDYLFFEMGYARGVATREWKYITVRYDAPALEKISHGFIFKGWQGRELKLPYYITNGHLGYHATLFHPHYFVEDQLFNLKDDPEEKNNAFDSQSKKAREMKNLLVRSLKSFPGRPYGELNR